MNDQAPHDLRFLQRRNAKLLYTGYVLPPAKQGEAVLEAIG